MWRRLDRGWMWRRSKRRRLDDEGEEPTAVQLQNNVSISPDINGFPLPNEVVERVTSFRGGRSFGDRVRVAAVCRQLRTAVIVNMQRMRRRFLKIRIENDHILVGDMRVENDLSSPNDVEHSYPWNRGCCITRHHMECVLALMEFGQPTNLYLENCDWQEKELRLIDVYRILSSVSPLSITRLFLIIHIEQFRGKTPFNDIMQVVGGMTNLETLYIYCRCDETPASLAHRDRLPSLPDDSPFNHLLKLERLRGLDIFAPELVSPKQQADLINRSPSTINHLCCLLPSFTDNETMLPSMTAVVRANITSACCWGVHSPMPLLLLTNLPNCHSICCRYSSDHPLPTRQQIDEMAVDLLTNCHDSDDRRGKTLQLKIGLFQNELQQYLANGGQTEFNHNREETVVSVTVGRWHFINDADCPYKVIKMHYL